jgi:hypothetical protein
MEVDVTSQIPSSQSINRLVGKALAAVGRQGFTALAEHIDKGRAEDERTQAEIDRLSVATSVGEPPAELVHALRATPGVQQLVRLTIHGRSTRAVINPLGYPDPARERAVWIQLCTLTPNSAAA